MGVVREYTCPSCHKSWEIFTGHGMMHGTLRSAAKTFPPDMRRKILGEASDGMEPLFHFVFQEAVCEECGSVVAVPVLEFPEKEQTYIGGCPQCGHKVRIIGPNVSVICPQCGEGRLEEEETGHWD